MTTRTGLAAVAAGVLAVTAGAGGVMEFGEPSAFRIAGDPFWSPRFALWRKVTVADVMDKFEGRRGTGPEFDWMSNFDKVAAGGIGKGGHVGPYFADGLVYETIRGVSDYLAAVPDSGMEARLDGWVRRVIAAQEPDGWINTRVQLNEPNRRWGENGACLVDQHGLYNLGLLVDAGLHHWRATGKTDLLAAGVKAANLMCAEIGPSPRHNRVPTHSGPEEAMVKLARFARENPDVAAQVGAGGRAEDYLSLVKFWMASRGDHCGQPVWDEDHVKIGDTLRWIRQHNDLVYAKDDPHKRPCWGDYAMDRVPLKDYRSIEGHAVRAALLATGLAALAAEPGCADWGEVASRLWDSMAGRKLYLTGGIGALSDYERFGGDYDLPNRAYLETCAAVGNAFFSMRMAELTGDGKYVDMVERVAYNALLTAVSKDGDRYTYQNPLEAGNHARWNWHGCPCCPPMFLKLTGALPGYVVSRDAEGVRLNLFVSGDAEVALGGGRTARFGVRTAYPERGEVSVRIDEDGEYAFRVRVPGWARGEENPYGLYVSKAEARPVLKVNGKTVDAPLENGYLTAGRSWKRGDRIELCLSSEIREIRADAKVGELKGKVAYASGPVVCAFEEGLTYPIPYYLVANRTTNAAFRVWVRRGEENPGELRRQTLLSWERRLGDIAAVKAGELRLRPTFACCGVSYGVGAERAVDFQYRKVGTAGWKQAPKPPYFRETLDCRGSILGLEEDTEYEVRVLVGRTVVKEGRFRTWASEVPVAKTVVLDPKKVRFPIRLRDRGTSEGWIRYTVRKGEVIDNPTGSACFIFEGARNVLLDDVVMRGCGSSFSVIVTNSVQVRIRNCDISHWGRVGTPDFSRHGMRFNDTLPPTREWGINFDGAIRIGETASEVVVERCWIHDPNGEANSWRYFHPAGPEAVLMWRPDHSTVIRWCDFTGSDEHRWNDAVESCGNFEERGGFNRDADVYGNFMNLCNDDCIELDGGQQNVRCFGNRFETALVGVSVQGNMAGPSYVLDNLFSGMGERFGECGQTIKTSGYDWSHVGPWCLVGGNVLWGGGTGLGLDSVARYGRYVVRDNVFCRGQEMTGAPGPSRLSNLVEEGNVFEAEIDERDLDASYPKRPLAFTLDRARVSGIRFGAEAPGPLTVTATSTAERPIAFAIAKNEVFGWFDVTPAAGEIPAGGRLAFTVTPRREKMDGRRFWRGAFLVRTPEGLSRPFSFELENTSFVEPFRCEKDGEFAAYAEVGQPFALTAERTFAFEAPKDGRYFFLVRAVAAQNAPYEVSVDGAPWTLSHVQGFANVANWSLVNRNCRLWGGRFKFFDLKAGRHTLGIRPLAKATERDVPSPIRVEGAVMTDSPGSFEPR